MMQRKRRIVIITACAACVLAFSAMAQNAPDAEKPSDTPTKNADNTERNARDASNQTLTPFDQGTSKADIATTAQIRKDVVAEKEMSVNAHNVKIITKSGKVTLRGPVNTSEEKQRIGEIADRTAGAGNVDNQLEVIVNADSNPKGE